MDNRVIRLLYATFFGRLFIKLLLKLNFPKAMAAYLRSPLSKPLIKRFVKKYDIQLEEYEHKKYRSFAEFFIRKKLSSTTDTERDHFTSPCDGWLSAYEVKHDSSFSIKGSNYRICDLIEDKELAEGFNGGMCLVFRLAANDYHHYSFVDDGYIFNNHFVEGTLHSVQPISCRKYPVYRLNRRCWSLMNTMNFGELVQVEIGALAVGGIVNDKENEPFEKGDAMGHFELCGSTIVIFVKNNTIDILPDILKTTASGREYRVRQGMWIASKQSCNDEKATESI